MIFLDREQNEDWVYQPISLHPWGPCPTTPCAKHIIFQYWFFWLFPPHSKRPIHILWAVYSISWNHLLMELFVGSWICFCSQCSHLLYGAVFWKRFRIYLIVGYQSHYLLLLRKFDCDQQYLCMRNIMCVSVEGTSSDFLWDCQHPCETT